MSALLDFEHYSYLFSPLPSRIIFLRFGLSWALRLTGLLSGIGILFRKDGFRKLALGLFVFTLFTVPWKHPVFGFRHHAAYLDQLLKDQGAYPLKMAGVVIPSFSSLAPVSARAAQAAEVLFALAFLYYFTRPKVKAWFKKGFLCTKDQGLLEGFLAGKRAQRADRLIPASLRGGRLLDIGCGPDPLFLLKTRFKYKYGLDASLGENLPKGNIIFERFDLEKEKRLSFESDFFDVVALLAVIEHIDPLHLPAVLKEIRRVLRPGGRLIITTPSPAAEKPLKLMAALGLVDFRKLSGHRASYSKTALLDCLRGAGFAGEKIEFGYFELFLNSWACADK
jgi:SAM-dependent methyltransferase